MKILKRICKIESIYIKPEAEKFVLSICNNSVRILINYLEKFKLLSKEIDVELATAVCTNIAFQEFITYTNLCKAGNIRDATALMYRLFDKGYSVMDILDNFFLFVKTTTLLTENEKYNDHTRHMQIHNYIP